MLLLFTHASQEGQNQDKSINTQRSSTLKAKKPANIINILQKQNRERHTHTHIIYDVVRIYVIWMCLFISICYSVFSLFFSLYFHSVSLCIFSSNLFLPSLAISCVYHSFWENFAWILIVWLVFLAIVRITLFQITLKIYILYIFTLRHTWIVCIRDDVYK